MSIQDNTEAREKLGKIVREIRIDFVKEQSELTGTPAKPGHLTEWPGLDETNKEVDRRIGWRLYELGYENCQLDLVMNRLAPTKINFKEGLL